ncbi:zinc finger BED domain-containing protein 5-like isoform X1 [Mauremys mutica]|uniref:zinc finger BED domain-containing protein 5-like isoform X1 n=1 Tax=Mauremys mutica TaxID=74926 RepID=UPI001D141AAF|nr:zinc finger BED domain-containing protein 5-like isoform X1 [Mauremys mutica]
MTRLSCEMGSQYDKLLLHMEVKWLSRGKVVNCVVSFKDELRLFLSEHNPELAENLTNERWLLILCYPVDTFEKLNDLDSSLQGKNSNILLLGDKISAFLKKLTLCGERNMRQQCSQFPLSQ